jgi:lipoprotein-releasing system permease protein
VVGNGICQKLSLGLFDLNYAFEVFVPRPGKSAITNPESAFNKSSLIPTGIYAVNDELDSKYVFADCALTQELLEFKPNQYSSVEIKCNEKTNEKKIIYKLNKIFDNKVVVKNRAQLNDSLHKMLNTENAAIYLIFTLVIILTLFTLAGAIIMMIIDKKDNLKTLYSIGTPIKTLKNIFLFQGTILTVLGGLLGIFLGAIVILIQQYYKVIMITESLPYPVIFNFRNVLIVFTTIVILGIAASLIASNRVTKKLLES